MEPIIAEIIRDESTREGALGSMFLNFAYFCETLQPDADEPKRFHIPPGVYRCKRFHGAKYKDTFEIVVKGHTALLFHAGNIEEDSLGCILLGSTRGKLGKDRAVLNSGNTFKKFMARLEDVDEFTLTITDV
jgi:hypothetical protein